MGVEWPAGVQVSRWPRRVPRDEARAVTADEFVPVYGRRRAPGRRRGLNRLARKTLVAGGKDVPDKPRRAPVLQRARRRPLWLGGESQNSPPALTAAAMISYVAPALLSASTIAVNKVGHIHRLAPRSPPDAPGPPHIGRLFSSTPAA
jgi:hypothetical protein